MYAASRYEVSFIGCAQKRSTSLTGVRFLQVKHTLFTVTSFIYYICTFCRCPCQTYHLGVGCLQVKLTFLAGVRRLQVWREISPTRLDDVGQRRHTNDARLSTGTQSVHVDTHVRRTPDVAFSGNASPAAHASVVGVLHYDDLTVTAVTLEVVELTELFYVDGSENWHRCNWNSMYASD